MGQGTAHAPAPMDASKPYSLWEIDVRMFDDAMKEIDRFTCRQDLFVGPEDFIVRIARTDGKGSYEDRGVMRNPHFGEGTNGFGGKFTIHLMENGAIFNQGTGGVVNFIMTATPTGPDHIRCFRHFEVSRPMKLWGKQVDAGTYYVTTEDQLLETAEEAPDEFIRPLQDA